MITITAEQLASAILTIHALHSQGKYHEAEIISDTMLAFDPDNAYLHVLLASSCHHQKKFPKAIQGYTRAIELQPEDIASFVNRGEIYLRSGKFIEAFEDLKRASELNIPDQDVFANRARLLMQMTSSALKAVRQD
jgi:tetratricopeptide (TPR) repeat protein